MSNYKNMSFGNLQEHLLSKELNFKAFLLMQLLVNLMIPG